MSAWLISDIHGEKKTFEKITRHIDYNEDSLYILGDVLDRGKDSLELLLDIRGLMQDYPGHIHLIKGNHELFCEMYIKGTLEERIWASSGFGGKPTIKSLKKLNKEEMNDICCFIEKLPIYMIVDSLYFGNTVLTHAGLDADSIIENDDGSVNVIKSIEMGYDRNPYNFLCSNDIHRMPTTNLDQFIVVGHTPCIYLEGASYEVLRRKRYMCIDSGGCHRDLGGKQSIYCVDTDEVIYV